MQESGWREQDFTIQRSARFQQSAETAIQDKQAIRDSFKDAVAEFEARVGVTHCPPLSFTGQDQVAAMNRSRGEEIASRNAAECKLREGEKMKDRDFCDRLYRLRIDSGLTQNELEIRCDMPLSVISQYEIGSRQPGLQAIKRLCKGLECTASQLIGI